MGKEHDVLLAAQSGNVSKLEGLIQSKPSKTTFSFASLRRGPNINWRDESGYTALHLAALNGHKDAVKFLLYNDASANVPDNAGSFPLHLAAFNGHHEVAKILFEQGPSKAEVNEPNMAGDTALHVAAQYGHRYVVQVLIEHHAELVLRNNKEETPLDLAAQYGHLSTVQLLLLRDRSLIQASTRKHSPLHLAARNGHQKVVELLLDSGMNVNALCDMGSALHCAALFGKVPVARVLLERGIDIKLVDSDGETVLDVLCKHPSQRSREITALIFEQSELMRGSGKENALSQKPHAPGLDVEAGSVLSRISAKPTQRVLPAGYDPVPPPRPVNGSVTQDFRFYASLQQPGLRQSASDSMAGIRSTPGRSDFASVTPPHNADSSLAFPSSKASPYAPRRSDAKNLGKECFLVGGIDRAVPSGDGIKSDRFLMNRADGVGNIPLKQKRTSSRSDTVFDSGDVYVGLVKSGSPTQNFVESYRNQPPFLSKPTTSFTTAANQQSGGPVGSTSPADSGYCVPPTRKEVEDTLHGDRGEVSLAFPPPSPVTHQRFIGDELRSPNVDRAKPESAVRRHQDAACLVHLDGSDESLKVRSQTLPVTPCSMEQASYINVNISNSPSSLSVRPHSAYSNVDPSNRSITTFTPDGHAHASPNLSQDSYYQDPPCLVFKSKSEAMAASVAQSPPDSVEEEDQAQARKLQSVKQKRTTIIKSDRDCTANALRTQKNRSPNQKAQIESLRPSPGDGIVKYSEIQASKVKQKRTNFLGTEGPRSHYTVVASVYEQQPGDLNVSKGYRMSKLPVDRTLNEQYEWNKIDSFLSSLEEFAASPTSATSNVPAVAVARTENLAVWLASLGMEQYEPAFISHGFDEIEFLGHSLEDQDLVELGVLSSHDRQKLIKAANDLAPAPVMGDANFPVSRTVLDWLTRIKLTNYAQRFMQYGYDNIDRVRVIWEIELATVLDVNILGHRKRMMKSLGRRPVQVINAKPWSERFAEANKPMKAARSFDDTMAIARDLLRQAENLSLDRRPTKVDKADFAPRKSKTSSSPGHVPDLSQVAAPPVDVAVMKTSTGTQMSPQATQRVSEDPEYFTNWKHHPDTLLYGCVTYPTQYLGSHPVQDVRGVISTLEACSKMKAISRNVRKMPIIELSISVRGIDYVDANSKMVISSYEIENISFCAQDPADMQVFAYITRDVLTQKNYCHVFKAASVDFADEVITTIGQSFHLAYEQHVKLLEVRPKSQTKAESGQTVGSSHLTRFGLSASLSPTTTQSNERRPPERITPLQRSRAV